jgi:hypothetical protein
MGSSTPPPLPAPAFRPSKLMLDDPLPLSDGFALLAPPAGA